MSTRITVRTQPIATIVNRLGAGTSGDVQRFVTNTINRRITKYMPYRSGILATKAKLVTSPTEIEVVAPYARYQYYGKVMMGKAPRTVTSRDLQYDHTKHPLAGPFWDRRMMTAERSAISKEVQTYIDRKAGKR